MEKLKAETEREIKEVEYGQREAKLRERVT